MSRSTGRGNRSRVRGQATSSRARTLMWPLARPVVHALGLVTSVAVGLSWTGSWFWLGELCLEWRALFALTSGLLGLGLWRARSTTLAALSLAAALVGAAPELALIWPDSRTPSSGPTLSILHSHAEHASSAAGPGAATLSNWDPDLVVLTRGFAQSAKTAAALQTYELVTRSAPGQDRAFQVLRRPDSAWRVAVGLRAGRALIQVNHQTGETVRVRILNLPAVGDLQMRSARLSRLRSMTKRTIRAPEIWIGQTGSDARNPALRGALPDALRDARQGLGRLGSWPDMLGPLASAPASLLVSGWVQVEQFRTEAALGGRGQRPTLARMRVSAPRR